MVMKHIPKTALAGATAAAAVTAAATMGDGALMDMGINLPNADLGERLTAVNPVDLFNADWWIFENPDPDGPIRILFFFFEPF